MYGHRTVGQEIRANAAHESHLFALQSARKEAKADALVSVSGHLDRLATHMDNEGLGAKEIIELLREEAEKMGKGGLLNVVS